MQHLRLIRRIANEGLHSLIEGLPDHENSVWRQRTASVLSGLSNSTLIDATDVIQQSHEQGYPRDQDDEIWPVGPTVWIEFYRPGVAAGCLCSAVELTDSIRPKFDDAPTDARWEIRVCVLAANDDHMPVVYGTLVFYIKPDGHLSGREFWTAHVNGREYEDAPGWRSNMQATYNCLLISMSLLGCDNVGLMPQSLGAKDQKRISSRLGRRRGSGEYSFNIIGVKAGTILAKRATGTPSGIEQFLPFSRVRGHVAKYGERFNRGRLFGKLEGKFYIPEHHKGDVANGVVEHAYWIKPDPNARHN